MLRRLILAFGIVILLTGFYRLPVAQAHNQMIQVSISRKGFDDNVDYEIRVEAGHQVTLTFKYADDDLNEDNPHDIRIKGPGLEDLPTVRVSKEQPTATLTFTPKKTGTIHILCVVPCIGMENLVGGVIKAEKPRMMGAPTSLALELSPRDDGSTLARAKLETADSKPIVGVPLTFSLRTSLGGELVLSNPTTMDDGSAVVKIPPMSMSLVKIMAQFEGGNGLSYAEASGVTKSAGKVMIHQPLALSAPTSPSMLVMILLLIVGGVWIAYGFVAYQVLRIWRE